MNSHIKIDAVVTWVDGNDPILNEKRRHYGSAADFRREDVGSSTRYADLGEIHCCIRSLNRFAPFINRIFIITDGQDPHVVSRIPVEIIDHRVIFRGYGQYLPTFNSLSIETMMHRIPGLSEHYILLNDDFLLLRETAPTDFFLPDGRAVCYTRIFPTFWERILNILTNLRDGYRRATFKRMLLNGCELQGRRHPFFFYLVHTPRPQLKSIYDGFFADHPECITDNIKYRFRSPDQYEPQALAYMIMWDRGLCKVVNPADRLLFIQHWNGEKYIKKKLEWADSTPSVRFACFNSLDKASAVERELIFKWIDTRLGK